MSGLLEVRVPADQSEGTRSQVLKWLKAIGASVTENEPLVELETDKVTVELPAPVSGVLRQILKAEGSEVEPGDVLAQIEIGAGAAAGDPASAEALPASAAGQTESARSARTESGTRDNLSPAVRRLLSEHGLGAHEVKGSGEGGRITAPDVLRAAEARRNGAAARAGDAHVEAPAASRRVAHSAMRKRIAAHMVQSLQTAPHVTSVFEADMSAVIAHRRQHLAPFEARGVALTLSAYFIAAAVDAIRAVPEANSRWGEEALEIYDTINMGVAAALGGGGLIVPVLRGVEARDLFDIARGLNDLVRRARAQELTPADLRGGTFTLSNHGTSGSLLAAPIVINQGQAAILGIGKLEKRATVIEEAGAERVAVRSKCYVTLTIDHRILDGQEANRFLQVFTARLESWSD
jgi:2-oxoglutarate dehydrogenase E2 component (dihydrolipoamide succinyltransferase)